MCILSQRNIRFDIHATSVIYDEMHDVQINALKALIFTRNSIIYFKIQLTCEVNECLA